MIYLFFLKRETTGERTHIIKVETFYNPGVNSQGSGDQQLAVNTAGYNVTDIKQKNPRLLVNSPIIRLQHMLSGDDEFTLEAMRAAKEQLVEGHQQLVEMIQKLEEEKLEAEEKQKEMQESPGKLNEQQQ
jgi:hypothetical protein